MNYCNIDQWVVLPETGQIGQVCKIVRRRTHEKDGLVWVQCGAGGPFVETEMKFLREATGKEYKIATGLIFHEN